MKTSWKQDREAGLNRAFLGRGGFGKSLFYTNGSRPWHEDISQSGDSLRIAPLLPLEHTSLLRPERLKLLEPEHKLNEIMFLNSA